MNKWYDKYLVKKYEPLYRDRYGDMRSTAMCWGFECGDGWFDIINNLSHFLCGGWLRAKENYDQIKDREGLKKFEWGGDQEWNVIVTREMIDAAKHKMDEAYENTPVASQVKEKNGGLRFYVHGATDEQYAYIAFAEAMSYSICEVCGDKGKINRDGWLETRCKEHREI